LEGCLGGSSGRFTLTDVGGRVYPLRGDTAQLGDHVGQQVSITGTEESESSSAGGAQSTFSVKKVKFVGPSCKTAKERAWLACAAIVGACPKYRTTWSAAALVSMSGLPPTFRQGGHTGYVSGRLGATLKGAARLTPCFAHRPGYSLSSAL